MCVMERLTISLPSVTKVIPKAMQCITVLLTRMGDHLLTESTINSMRSVCWTKKSLVNSHKNLLITEVK